MFWVSTVNVYIQDTTVLFFTDVAGYSRTLGVRLDTIVPFCECFGLVLYMCITKIQLYFFYDVAGYSRTLGVRLDTIVSFCE